MTKKFFKSIGWFWIEIVHVMAPQKDSRNLSLINWQSARDPHIYVDVIQSNAHRHSVAFN